MSKRHASPLSIVATSSRVFKFVNQFSSEIDSSGFNLPETPAIVGSARMLALS